MGGCALNRREGTIGAASDATGLEKRKHEFVRIARLIQAYLSAHSRLQ